MTYFEPPQKRTRRGTLLTLGTTISSKFISGQFFSRTVHKQFLFDHFSTGLRNGKKIHRLEEMEEDGGEMGG